MKQITDLQKLLEYAHRLPWEWDKWNKRAERHLNTALDGIRAEAKAEKEGKPVASDADTASDVGQK